MNRIMRNSGAALAAIFIAGSLTACGPGSASSSRSDTNPTEVSTDLGNKKYELTLWDGAGLKVVPEFLRTLVFARPRGDDQFADCTFSPSLDMSR